MFEIVTQSELGRQNSTDRYMNLTDIGKHYGVSRVMAGRFLYNVGLRHKDGTPTKMALDGGYCNEANAGKERKFLFWIWHASRTLMLIEAAIQDPAGFMTAQRESAAANRA
jgi:hypothetical protein